MQNLDIIILTSILSILFIVFAVVVFKEFKVVSKDGYKAEKENGPRANLIKFVGSLFDDKIVKMSPKQKIIFYKHVQRTISDMESDGVYFPEEVKEELDKKRQSLICEYSGLPSMLAYIEDKEI